MPRFTSNKFRTTIFIIFFLLVIAAFYKLVIQKGVRFYIDYKKEKANEKERIYQFKKLNKKDSIEKANIAKSESCKEKIILGMSFGINKHEFDQYIGKGFYKVPSPNYDLAKQIHYNYSLNDGKTIRFNVEPHFRTKTLYDSIGLSYEYDNYLYKVSLVCENYFDHSLKIWEIIKAFKEKYKNDTYLYFDNDRKIGNKTFRSKHHLFISCNRKISIYKSDNSFSINYIDLVDEYDERKFDSINRMKERLRAKKENIESQNEI